MMSRWRNLFSLAFAVLSVASKGVLAQDHPLGGAPRSTRGSAPTAEQLLAQRVAVLASPTFTKAAWTVDYDDALAQAEKSGKPIFAYFTRSYQACPPCKKLELGLFSEPAFAEFGKEVVLFCHVTSHVEGDKYQGLLAEKGGTTFPFLVLLDAKGEVIARLSTADPSVEAFRAVQKRSAEIEVMQAHLPATAFDVLVAKEAIGGITFARAKALATAMGEVDAAKRKVVDDLLVKIEVVELAASVRLKSDAVAVGKRFAEMWKQGLVPTGVPARNFFTMILEAMEDGQDPEGFAKALDEYRKLVEGKRNAAAVLQLLEQRLKKLRDRAKDD
jgi:hypothetical protein